MIADGHGTLTVPPSPAKPGEGGPLDKTPAPCLMADRPAAGECGSAPARDEAAMTTETGDWVGRLLDRRYQVTAKLGEGGMGFVYRARDGRLDCDVVIKAPRAALLEDAGFRQRFRDEVSALVQLAHPHVVKISDFGQHDAVPFAVMQYLPGGSLDDRRPRHRDGRPRPVAPRALAGWLLPVAEALDFIHRRGYVHRDIKPANILFDA